MAYDFKNLSPADFEDLVRDLIGRELGFRFEAFGQGSDEGMDGRHAKDGTTILQAKHYAGSTYAALKSKMKSERTSIDRLAPSRYILATSRSLSPKNKKELGSIIGPSFQTEADMFGRDDLNALLRKYSDIEKSHIKLWLSGSAVLVRVLRSAAHTYNNITKAEIEAKVRVYAPNPSFSGAQDTLEANHVVIISGPPGVGKTTLAEMLSYAYIAEGWDLVAVRSLDDGFASIDDTKKQVFYFDDFLGKVALDHRALSQKDSDVVRFIKRVGSSPNARFILTTRAYIFEDARRVSEHLADRRLDISKYVLDVGVYTRRIKARILYNHILVADTPLAYVTELVESGDIAKIVDHKNYNPRIIEWMTDVAHIGTVEPKDYLSAFLEALDHPGRLWDIAFRTHISKRCQHFLFALFFCSDHGVRISKLRGVYEKLHAHLCAKYGEPHDPKDFEEALRILEGGFITISGKRVNFVNPSLRDYLTDYLSDLSLLREFATCALETEWAQAVWLQGKQASLSENELESLALSFLTIAERFLTLPLWVSDSEEFYREGLSNTDRLGLLLAWWQITTNQRFVELVIELSRNPVDGLDSWRDGPEAVELIAKLRDGDHFPNLPLANEMADNLEQAFIEMARRSMPWDELENISDAVEEWKPLISIKMVTELDSTINMHIKDVREAIEEIDSDSTLNEYLETLETLAGRVSIAEASVKAAESILSERIAELEDQTTTSESPSFDIESSKDVDQFDDVALKNLFAPLISR